MKTSTIGIAFGVIVILVVAAGAFFFFSQSNVPISKRLTSEKLVKLNNVEQVNFADAAEDLPPVSGDAYACPSDGTIVADPAECESATIPENEAVNCDGTVEEYVCGQNGETYVSECYARADNVQFVPGVCKDTAEELQGEETQDGEEDQPPGQPDLQVNNCELNPDNPVCDSTSSDGTEPEQLTADCTNTLTDAQRESGVNALAGQCIARNAGGSITLNAYAFDQAVGENDAIPESTISKFIVLNLTVNNNGVAVVEDPIAKMKIIESASDIGSSCNRRAADVMPNAFLSTSLQPGETRTGLVACEVSDNANKIVLKYNALTLTVVDYTISTALKKSGAVGQLLSSQHTAMELKVNEVTYYSDPARGTYYRGVSIPVSVCINDVDTGDDDNSDCSIAFVNVTVTNKVNLPWTQSFDVNKFRLVVNERSKTYHRNVNEVLQQEGKALNLENMAYGEQRTGLVPFVVGEVALARNVPITLTRASTTSSSQDLDNYRGYFEVTIK